MVGVKLIHKGSRFGSEWSVDLMIERWFYWDQMLLCRVWSVVICTAKGQASTERWPWARIGCTSTYICSCGAPMPRRTRRREKVWLDSGTTESGQHQKGTRECFCWSDMSGGWWSDAGLSSVTVTALSDSWHVCSHWLLTGASYNTPVLSIAFDTCISRAQA